MIEQPKHDTTPWQNMAAEHRHCAGPHGRRETEGSRVPFAAFDDIMESFGLCRDLEQLNYVSNCYCIFPERTSGSSTYVGSTCANLIVIILRRKNESVTRLDVG